MFKMMRADPIALDIKHLMCWKHREYNKLVAKLLNANQGVYSGFGTKVGDIYFVFESKVGKPPQMIQTFTIKANSSGYKFVEAMLPHGWWMSKKDKKAMLEAAEESCSYAENTVSRNRTKNEDFHADG
jgi:hypothetical protein